MYIKSGMLITLLCLNAMGQEKMTMEEYQQRYQAAKEREAAALPRIAQLKTLIASIKEEISDVKKQSERVWNEILDALGITQQDYDNFLDEIDQLKSTVQNFASQYYDNPSKWEKELGLAEKEARQLRENKIAYIPRVEEFLRELDESIVDSKQSLNQAKAEANTSQVGSDEYIVQLIPGDRDCLWKIAQRPEIFGDGSRWREIYEANRDIIKNPNLIFPGQLLKIPR